MCGRLVGRLPFPIWAAAALAWTSLKLAPCFFFSCALRVLRSLYEMSQPNLKFKFNCCKIQWGSGSRFTNFTTSVFDCFFLNEKLLEEKTVIVELGESKPWNLDVSVFQIVESRQDYKWHSKNGHNGFPSWFSSPHCNGLILNSRQVHNLNARLLRYLDSDCISLNRVVTCKDRVWPWCVCSSCECWACPCRGSPCRRSHIRTVSDRRVDAHVRSDPEIFKANFLIWVILETTLIVL